MIRFVKRLLLGDERLPQQVTVALREPQSEVVVWLHGNGASRDVTHLHSVACASPFMVCISFSSINALEQDFDGEKVQLELRESSGAKRVLGKIGLKHSTTILVEGRHFGLFEAKSCASYCLPQVRFWAHYMQQAYWRWRDRRVPNVRMSAVDAHAMMVMFLCPRPVVLVTAMEERSGNIFPMNLMGSLGDEYFSFALNAERQASQCVRRVEMVALSSVPYDKQEEARELGKQHMQISADWDRLPFSIRHSLQFEVPVPEFALSVREVEIRAARDLGSHTFFVGKVVREEKCAEAPAFFMIHGMYQRVRSSNENARR
jgi:flavin reductase (DIM6/NTAB) family NADH-FMN oxidoreductase RutF